MSLYLKEFPDYDGKLYIPDGWIDNSWHNDLMPRSQKTKIIPKYGDCPQIEVTYIIWQNYINLELREYEDTKRYMFEIQVNDVTVFVYWTDDLEDLKEIVKELKYIID